MADAFLLHVCSNLPANTLRIVSRMTEPSFDMLKVTFTDFRVSDIQTSFFFFSIFKNWHPTEKLQSTITVPWSKTCSRLQSIDPGDSLHKC